LFASRCQVRLGSQADRWLVRQDRIL
jgi:hypothetical protein